MRAAARGKGLAAGPAPDAVMRDIDGALGKGGAASALKSPGPRLEALAVQFEAEHPAVAQLLRQIGALLGQAGI